MTDGYLIRYRKRVEEGNEAFIEEREPRFFTGVRGDSIIPAQVPVANSPDLHVDLFHYPSVSLLPGQHRDTALGRISYAYSIHAVQP